MKALFQDALVALWRGQIEDDGFNALVLDAQLSWRQIMMLRAYAKYLRQAGTRFSQDYIERVLTLQHHRDPAAGPAVRVPVRPAPGRPARPSAARRSPRRSAASLTTSPCSTTTGCSAPTWR